MKQKILLAGALLLVLVQPADAVELYAGIGRCTSDLPSVCDEGMTINAHVSQSWPTAVEGVAVQVRLDHISHYDNDEYKRLFGSYHGSGQINAVSIGLAVEW